MIQKKTERERKKEHTKANEARCKWQKQSSLGEFFVLFFQLSWVYFKLCQNCKLPKNEKELGVET